MLGNKRIPLPSCAYSAIREAFPAAESEAHTGFDLDEESWHFYYVIFYL